MQFHTRDDEVGQFEQPDPASLLRDTREQLSSFQRIRRVLAEGPARAGGTVLFPMGYSTDRDAA